MADSFVIRPVSRENIGDINAANEPFELIGRLIPVFDGASWHYSEQLFDSPSMKRYPDEEADWAEYISSPDREVFIAYVNGECAGRIRIRKNWNRFCFIEDIAVAARFRGRGIGSGLLASARDFARSAGLRGLALETQDNNLKACRFYAKNGFVLGGADALLYEGFPDSRGELALFWYLLF